MAIHLTDYKEPINNLQIKIRSGQQVRLERLPKYTVWSPDGKCLEEFRRVASAERWCRETKDFAGIDKP